MNKLVRSEENLPPYPQISIQQDADNSTLAGGMQAAIGDDNIQIQGHGNTITQTKILQISVEEIKTRQFIQTSPYKGLKKFELEDKDLFFGRDQFITQLVKKLEHSNLILLLGASGSGKSSVVRAGLIPWLSRNLSRKWGSHFVHLTFTPDQDPFESLYASLLSEFPQKKAQFAREAKADTVTQVIAKLKQSESFWFIFIDQFEELFTITLPEKRDQFINGLVKLSYKLSQTKNNSVKIVGTIRADFLDKLSPYPQLIKTTDDGRPLIAEMQLDELRLAIEQPAAHHGVVFEAGLVEEITKNIQGQAGCLPLLQYTLNLLWETEVQTGSIYDRTLNTSTYRQLGGVRGTLQQHMDGIYEKLPEAEKLAAKRIFLKLVGITGNSESGTEGQPVLRRALRSEFGDELEKSLLVKLIDENLLVSDRQPQSQESTVEIAHEMLLTAWTTLNDWIEQNRQAIALRNRLYDDVARWQGKKAEDELWAGSKLEQVIELRNSTTFNQVLGGFNEAASQFIDASVGLRDQQLRRARIFAGFGFTLAALTTITSIFAFTQWNGAQQQSIVALNQASESSLLSNRQLEALVAAVQAGKKLKDAILKPNAALQQTVIVTLQQAVYGVQERNRLLGHEAYINVVSFSPDGQMIASGSNDSTIKLWSREGKLLKTLPKGASSISFSPDSKTIVSGNYGNTIQLWSRGGQLLKEFLKEHTERINSISLSPDGEMIASGSHDDTIKLWSLNGQLLKTLYGHRDNVRSVTFSPDGQMIASISADETIKLWSRDGQPLRTFFGRECQDKCQQKGEDDVGSVSFSPNGQMIASGGYDGTVKLWSRDGQLLKTLYGHSDRVTNVSFSRDGKTIASSSLDSTVILWSRERPPKTLHGHQRVVSSVSFSPDGETLASASWDGTIKLWNPNGQPLQTLSEHREDVNSVSFSPDGKMIVSGSNDNTIKLWSRDGQPLQTLSEHREDVNSVSFSPDSKMIVSGSNDNTIKLWNLASPDDQPPKTLPKHISGVTSVSFSPDGKTLASGSYNNDNTIRLWSRESQLLKPLPEPRHIAGVTSVSFSPDGKTLASASEDSTVKLWSLNSQEFTKTLTGHGTLVNSVSFSPDGKILASGSNDNTIKFWSREGRELKILTGHRESVNSVSFSPDGKTLASASADDTVILWNLDLDDLLIRGCDWLRDYLKNGANLSKSDRHLCHGISNTNNHQS